MSAHQTPALDLPPADTGAAQTLVASPYLHYGGDRFYNPLTDRSLAAPDPLFPALDAVWGGRLAAHLLAPGVQRELASGAWLVAAEDDLSRRFHLKYVALEAHTVCNQACYFCPVSVDPRGAHFMATELYERIVGELAAWRDTIEAVFMINYNEPTADRRFVEQVRTIRAAGLPPAVLTNGTGLTPARVDALVALGGLRFLSINLSTLDREKYAKDRGGDHLDMVLRHLDYAKDQPLAEQMDIVVLGTGDERHKADFAAIGERFAGSRFTAKYFEVMDRAGYLAVGMKAMDPARRLCGCENIGSRPLQHLHITPRAECVLCCEDYDERYVVGNLERQSVAEVLAGPELARYRRWAYGVEDAPESFICRKCVFARTGG